MKQERASEGAGSIELANCSIRRVSLSRIDVAFLPGAVVTEQNARDILDATDRLMCGRKALVLVDMRGLGSIEASARLVFAGGENARISHAVALLVSSPTSRLVGNFFLLFNRPRVPTRLVSSQEEGIEWLNQQERGIRNAE